jgi:aminopeptidase N
LQWLGPAQTSGKRQPFLYSNPFAINARSYIPLQDLPGVRSTYEATLRTPYELVAVMAAERLTNQTPKGVFKFRMPQPVPSYWFPLRSAIAFKPTGLRSGIWARPGLLDAAAREFADTEQMLVAVESVYGPYRWDRYDALIMPPALPFGGVENPRLTFMSPTVIAGDKSLVYVLAHEIAHSWSGNLVNHLAISGSMRVSRPTSNGASEQCMVKSRGHTADTRSPRTARRPRAPLDYPATGG